MLRALSLCTCCRQYPGAATGRRLRSSHPALSAFPEVAVGSACTSSFSRLAWRLLALRPAHSRRHLYVTCYTEGFSHFVTSMTAPVASGWSVRRVGLAPTGKRRLLTAHANSGHVWTARRTGQYDPIEPTGRSQAKVRQGPTRRSAYESTARLGHVLLDATPIFGVEPCETLLASPFRPRLGVRCGWSPFPKDSSDGQTTR